MATDTDELVLTASVNCRKVPKGFKVEIVIHSSKSTSGRIRYHSLIRFAADINFWVARIIANYVSDIENLNLHSAIRALEVRHVCTPDVCLNMLRGSGYALTITSKQYYEAIVYKMFLITPLIKTK